MKPILTQEIINKKKFYDYLLNLTLFIGSISFIIVGINSYLKINNILDINILFIPQGITMLFYGLIGSILSFTQLLKLYWEIGEGYNKFDLNNNNIVILRKSYPGEKKNIELNLKINDIVRIKKYFRKKAI